MLPCKVLIAVFMAFYARPVTSEASDFIDVLQLGAEIFTKVFDVWQDYPANEANVDPDNGMPPAPIFPSRNRRERAMLMRMAEIGRLVERAERSAHGAITATVDVLRRDLPDIVRLELRLDRLTQILSSLSSRNADMHDYINRGYDNSTEINGDSSPRAWRLERLTLENFALSVVSSDPNSVRSIVSELHSMIVPGKAALGRSGVLDLLQEKIREHNMACSTQQSAHQLVLNLFGTMQLAQLQGFQMVQFSYMLLRMYGKGNFTIESELEKERYMTRQRLQIRGIKEVLNKTSNTAWRCDPKQHIRGKTYDEVTRLLQGFIVNEVDMNEENSCTRTCPDYIYAQTQSCYSDMFCSKQPKCHGRLLSCKFIDSDMTLCQSKNSSSARRYDWVKYESGRNLGNTRVCSTSPEAVDSWWRFVYHCSYCMCLCDETGPDSDRYFSLLPSLADVDQNRAVTGVRFIKKNRIFHLQIQDGVVKKHGSIDADTVRWVPVNELTLHGRSVVEGRDYWMMDWSQRSVDLDDLIAPPKTVMTGLRFRRLGNHLNLVIRVTPIDIQTGQLQPSNSFWLDHDIEPLHRTKLEIPFPDVPTRGPPSIPTSKSGQYLEFSASDLDKDVSQTTVPFIETQEVVPQPHILLSGLGVYHKGREGYGGFLAVQVFTFDFADHLQPMMHESTESNRADISKENYEISQSTLFTLPSDGQCHLVADLEARWVGGISTVSGQQIGSQLIQQTLEPFGSEPFTLTAEPNGGDPSERLKFLPPIGLPNPPLDGTDCFSARRIAV